MIYPQNIQSPRGVNITYRSSNPYVNLVVTMPESQANHTGSNEPSKVPFGKWDTFFLGEIP